ncbi:MBL fold metallo-hydrolase [Bacillus testis]|uniref:MBL fold metallo-hydrolase n=1 Tax=Bacillus testis TaxID=1622072 RepID=UPI00067EAB3A|nr:MBL fold metallo-hydrolase [Bacillus testis]
MRKRYYNYDRIKSQSTLRDTRRWQKERRKKIKDLSIRIPQSSKKEAQALRRNRSDFSITWIGHSTFLIQADGANILTDPVWANWMGYERRETEPGLPIEELPDIDYVLLSHNHYDHLHYGSLRKLKGNITYLVPHGMKNAFRRKGFTPVIEAEWWDTYKIGSLAFSFVPAQHWTRRGLTDANTSHWGGWVIQSSQQTVYFAGDSAYFRGFKEIGEAFDIDYTLMPIGAYEPEWMMGNAHLTPKDAVMAFMDTRGRVMVPMHYGAYRLADDTGPEALDQLFEAWEQFGLEKGKLAVLAIGETLWNKA